MSYQFWGQKDEKIKYEPPNEIELLGRAIAKLVSESFDPDRNEFYTFTGKLRILLAGFDRFRDEQVKQMRSTITELVNTGIPKPILLSKETKPAGLSDQNGAKEAE